MFSSDCQDCLQLIQTSFLDHVLEVSVDVCVFLYMQCSMDHEYAFHRKSDILTGPHQTFNGLLMVET